MDDELWSVQNLNNTWGNWYKVATTGTLLWDSNCPDCSSPAAGSRGSANLDVYVRGLDDKLWVTTWDGGATWSGYTALGGVLNASPGTVTRARTTNRADVVGMMGEEQVNGDPVHYGAWLKQYAL